ncbi:hypothetical protein SARC_04703 [Sphaeroforma arctica JP610]|uniref:LNR domain-containing protein n=1 Tax=Sphaeroforma arctica JP610 TaxID=667725 RepID=A0A0L0G1L2_9EUKA|nr:hypothetical protein SARC_04703 [Sphaeroforma arctica JP610]KNC83032.1 hypothetical protein SARC_04703 [Sphaeroforma arctica JP610]|eukprot:XP_014156934.1 hypothetical protein SARC_04703 [Sphaeroforma arctica JP610]
MRTLILALAVAASISNVLGQIFEEERFTCRTELMHNGACDHHNNVLECGFDGGDCCLATCDCTSNEEYVCLPGCHCNNLDSAACGSPVWTEADCKDPNIGKPNAEHLVAIWTGNGYNHQRETQIRITFNFLDGKKIQVTGGWDTSAPGRQSERSLNLEHKAIESVTVTLLDDYTDGWFMHSGVRITLPESGRVMYFPYQGWLNSDLPEVEIGVGPSDMVDYQITLWTGNNYLGDRREPLYLILYGEGPEIGILGENTTRIELNGYFSLSSKLSFTVFANEVGDVSHLDIIAPGEDAWFMQAGILITHHSVEFGVRSKYMPANGWVSSSTNSADDCTVSADGEGVKRVVSGSGNIVEYLVDIALSDAADAGREGPVSIQFYDKTDYYSRAAELGSRFPKDGHVKVTVFAQKIQVAKIRLQFGEESDDPMLVDSITVTRPDLPLQDPIQFTIGEWMTGGESDQTFTRVDFEQIPSDIEMADLDFDTIQFLNNFRAYEVDIQGDDLECALEESCLLPIGERVMGETMGDERIIIRFETTTWNVGNDVFYPPPEGEFVWHACHNHYHGMTGYATYYITTAGSFSNIILRGHKASHCVMDSTCERSGNDMQHRCTNQGIAVGCADTYSRGLDCQWVDVTPLPAGWYVMNVNINLDKRVREYSYFNNDGHILFQWDPSQPKNDMIVQACLIIDESLTECPPDTPQFDQMRPGTDGGNGGTIEPEKRFYADVDNGRW